MKVLSIFIFLTCIYHLHSQSFNASVSINGSNNLVVTLNSPASFELNQAYNNPDLVIIVKNVFQQAAPVNYSMVDGGSGITYNSTGGTSGAANHLGTYGITFGLYDPKDLVLAFSSGSFSSGNIITFSQGQVIGLGNYSNPPSINPGPYTAYIPNAEFTAIAAPQVPTLPIELIHFDAVQSDEKIQLWWSTASEINHEKFEIEKSSDDSEFLKIGEIQGSGNSLAEKEYVFDDLDPSHGTLYYRLKQIDFDGAHAYSEVISVNFQGGDKDFEGFYPNPGKMGLVNLDYFAESDGTISVLVFDVAGKLVGNKRQSISSGNNKLSFDFSDLPKGIYTAKIGNEDSAVYHKLMLE